MLDLIKIGKFIVSLRREKGISQLELAKKMKVSNSAVNKWEQGICLPSKDKINKLIKYFNITLNEFYLGERISKQKTKKIPINIKRVALLVITLLLVLIIALFICNNKTNNYKLLSENGNYVGNIFISKKSKIIVMTNLLIESENNLKIESSCFEYFVMIGDELILHNGDIKSCQDNNRVISIEDYIKEIQINLNNDFNYTIFTNNINNKKIIITINYLNKNGEISKYNMAFDIIKY